MSSLFCKCLKKSSLSGLRDLEVLVTGERVVCLEAWPAICREIVDIFTTIYSAHRPSFEFRSSLETGHHPAAFLDLGRRIVEAVGAGGRGPDQNGEIVKLLQSILNLLTVSEVETKLLWSELGFRILGLVVRIQCGRSKVQVINSIAEFAKTKKVTPETYFHLGTLTLFYISQLVPILYLRNINMVSRFILTIHLTFLKTSPQMWKNRRKKVYFLVGHPEKVACQQKIVFYCFPYCK